MPASSTARLACTAPPGFRRSRGTPGLVEPAPSLRLLILARWPVGLGPAEFAGLAPDTVRGPNLRRTPGGDRPGTATAHTRRHPSAARRMRPLSASGIPALPEGMPDPMAWLRAQGLL